MYFLKREKSLQGRFSYTSSSGAVPSGLNRKRVAGGGPCPLLPTRQRVLTHTPIALLVAYLPEVLFLCSLSMSHGFDGVQRCSAQLWGPQSQWRRGLCGSAAHLLPWRHDPTHPQKEKECEIFPQIFLTHQVGLQMANQIWVTCWELDFLYIFLWYLGKFGLRAGWKQQGETRLAERWGNLWKSVKKWLHFYTLLCCTRTWHSRSSFLDERDRVSFCLTHLPGRYFHLPPPLVPFCRAVSGTSILRQTQESPLKWFTAGLHLFRSCLGQMQRFRLCMEGFLQTLVEWWSPLLYLWLFNPSSRFLYFFYSSGNIRVSLYVCRI